MGRWWRQSALVLAVFVLGLLQGSRAALGRMPEAPEPAAHGEAPGQGVRETDTVRGHFFRPRGSTAVRPELRLRQSRWTPDAPARVALACPDPSC